jgi:anti-sigma regulatory factor (Ser/Thr protein kinase)
MRLMTRGPEMVEELFGDARVEYVRPLRRAVTRVAVQEGAERGVIGDVALCVQEALTNIVRHAYGGRTGPIEVRVMRAPQELEVIVRDMGTGVVAHTADEDGYGLEIMNRLTRRLSISPAPGGGTEVRMSFPLGEQDRLGHGRAVFGR